MNHIVKKPLSHLTDVDDIVVRRGELIAELARRLTDVAPSLDGEAVFAELRRRHAERLSGK